MLFSALSRNNLQNTGHITCFPSFPVLGSTNTQFIMPQWNFRPLSFPTDHKYVLRIGIMSAQPDSVGCRNRFLYRNTFRTFLSSATRWLSRYMSLDRGNDIVVASVWPWIHPILPGYPTSHYPHDHKLSYSSNESNFSCMGNANSINFGKRIAN
jgi:hypothetical protein